MSTDTIILDVRGTSIRVFKSTIEQLTYFESKIERWSKDQDKIFVDCDPILFGHALNFITISNYKIPDEHIHNVQMVLDFYSPEKFTINNVQKFVFYNGIYKLKSLENKKNNKNKMLISFEHKGIVEFYCTFYDHAYLKCLNYFTLKIWDAYTSIEFINKHDMCNLSLRQIIIKNNKTIFKIPKSILSKFKDKIFVQYIPDYAYYEDCLKKISIYAHLNHDDLYIVYGEIDVSYLKKE